MKKRQLLIFIIAIIAITHQAESFSIEAFEPIDNGKIFPMSSSPINNLTGDLRDIFFVQRAFLGNISSLSSLYNTIINTQFSPTIFIQNTCNHNTNELITTILASQAPIYYNVANPNQWSSQDALAVIKLNATDIQAQPPINYSFQCVDAYTVNYAATSVNDVAQFALIPNNKSIPTNNLGVELQIGLTKNITSAMITSISPQNAAITNIEVFKLISVYQTPNKVFNKTCSSNAACSQTNISIQKNSLYEFLACNDQNICDVRIIPT